MKPRHCIDSARGLVAALFTLLGVPGIDAANVIWENTATDFNAGGSWVGDFSPGTADRAVFNTAAVTQPNLTSSLTIQGLSFETSGSGYTLTSTNSSTQLTLTNTGAATTTSAINTASGTTNTIVAPIVLGGAAGTTQTFFNAGNLTFNGPVSSTNAITGLSLVGGASAIYNFNVANTYSGTTFLGLGVTVNVNNAQAFSSGTIRLSGAAKIGAGTDLTGANKIANNIQMTSNLTLLNSGGFAMQFGGTVDLGGGARTLQSQVSAGTTFDGVISNDGGLGFMIDTFSGSSTSVVTLNGVNTYTGNTTLFGNPGSGVRVSSIGNAGVAGNLGAGTAINLGVGAGTGRLIYTGTGENTSKAIILNNASGSIEQAGTGHLNFTAANVASTGTAAGRTLTLLGSTSGTGEISGTIVNPTSNTTAVTKDGTGTWILSGTNTYTNFTTINAGVLQATDGVGLPTASILRLRGGVLQTSGTFNRTVGGAVGNVNWGAGGGGFAAKGGVLNLQLNGGTGTLAWGAANFIPAADSLIFGSSSADNLVDLQNGVNLGSNARTVRVNDNASSMTDIARISGALSGASGGIVKEGAGVLELTGPNTYGGATAVNAGTLLINGNMSGAAGTVTVAAGGTLGGSGTVGGATILNGTLSAGNSPGTLTFASDLTINNTANVVFEGGDLVNVGGLLSLNETWTLTLTSGFQDGGSFTLFNYTTLAALPELSPNFNLAGLGFTPTSSLLLTDTGSSIVLNGISAVPEPSNIVMVLFGLGMMALLRRSRRNAGLSVRLASRRTSAPVP